MRTIPTETTAGTPPPTTDPIPLSYSPGSFTIATNNYVIINRHLKLYGTQRVTIQGTGTLRIN